MVLLLQKCDTFCFSTCGGWPGHVDESIEQRASLLAALKALWPERSSTHRVEYADHVVQNAQVVRLLPTLNLPPIMASCMVTYIVHFNGSRPSLIRLMVKVHQERVALNQLCG